MPRPPPQPRSHQCSLRKQEHRVVPGLGQATRLVSALLMVILSGTPARAQGVDLPDEVRAVFQAHRAATPTFDNELSKCAQVVIAKSGHDDIRGALRRCGVAAGLLVPVVAAGAQTSGLIRAQLLKYVARSVIPQQVTHFGVAQTEGKAMVVFVRRRFSASLWPAPDKSDTTRYWVRGALSGPKYSRLAFVVGRPDGRVDRFPARLRRRQVSARVRFRGGAGRYVLELVGDGPSGLEVLALRVISVGIPALRTVRLTPAPHDESKASLADLHQLAVSHINRARRGLSLPPLVRDTGLNLTAQSHAHAMARLGLVAHRLPGGRSAAKRLRRAGIRTERFYENVAMARTVEQAHRELWDSPSHRLAIIDPTIRRLGVGIVRKASEGGEVLFVVQHFAH